MADPRILFFSPRECWPLNTGARLRDYHLARQLARQACVTYVGMADPGSASVDGPAQTDVGSTIESGLPRPADIFERVVIVPRSQPYSLANLLRGFLGPVPFTVLNFTTSGVTAALQELSSKTKFDSIQMEGVHLLSYLPTLLTFRHRPPILCDWHNIESEIMWRYAETVSSLPKRLYARRTARLIERAEADLLRGCDIHTVVSHREKEKLHMAAPDASLHVIENGVDTAFHSPAEMERAYARWPKRRPIGTPRNRVVFAGSMDYHANVDAVEYFARQVWPEARQRLSPDVRFTIVGRNPSAEVRNLSTLPGVEVTGTVADVRCYYQEAIAMVVPLRVGGGTRLKILEAMAAGVPVVSTTLGAEGLDVRDKHHLLIADSPAAMADALYAVERQPQLWQQLSSAGRELTARKYDWQMLGARLFEIHCEAIESKRSLP
jgi:glycosyltransferase involved in cell wall biosynthesis